jgi:PDZ domain-containing protein
MDVTEYVADLLLLEEQVQTLLAGQRQHVEQHPGGADALRRFEDMVEAHRASLTRRLSDLGGTERSEPTRLMPLPLASVLSITTAGPTRVSRALHACSSAFNHLAFAYGVLHAVAHRFYDSQGEGNTAEDLAEVHLRRYAGAVQEINQLLSDVVVWELGSAGEECRCQCPSCGLGICLCAPHGIITVNRAWRETIPGPTGPGIEVRPPRIGTPAVRAGLAASDRIVGVDDQELATDLDAMTLQKAVSAHDPGQPIRLEVLRGGSDRLHVEVTRP